MIHSVSDLTKFIKNMFQHESILQGVMVKGEVSNFKIYPSGHAYFTLKDSSSALKCVMFKRRVLSMAFIPRNGMQVIAEGDISVYERDGVYQLYAERLVPDGEGERALAFEQLKERLASEGLFDEKFKKALPLYPKTIGIVTSSSGAVLHDIYRVSKRRNDKVRLVLYPVLVQGDGAAEEISHAIDFFNERYPVDVLIVGRGGGSMEDLWAFNEEIVARAIFKSKIPVISAVGHETDFTLADFVADVRAATPSQAAELAVSSKEELKRNIDNLIVRLVNSKNHYFNTKRNMLKMTIERFLKRNPRQLLNDKKQELDLLREKLEKSSRGVLEKKKLLFESNVEKMELLNPIRVMRRGYSIATDSDGKVIKRIADVKVDNIINLMLADGRFRARVIEK